MSKSKGNTIQPQDVLKNYGADALRYWAASSKLGEDFDYQEKDVITGKKFVTKLFNATNFVFGNIGNYKPKKTQLMGTDKMLIATLNKLVARCTETFESYEYSRAKTETDIFFWSFCDNYLEIVKNRVYNGTKEERESAFYTLYTSLLTILKLMAPFTPFITEEIYQKYFKEEEKKKSIHISEWPEEIKIEKSKKNDIETYNLLLEIIGKARQEKSMAKKSMKSEIRLTIEKKDKEALKEVLDDLKSVTNAREIKEGKFHVEFL